MAFEYPKTVFLCKVSLSDTKKSKTNIKNHFCKFLALIAQKNLWVGLYGLCRAEYIILDHFWITATYFDQNPWSNSFWTEYPKTSHCVVLHNSRAASTHHDYTLYTYMLSWSWSTYAQYLHHMFFRWLLWWHFSNHQIGKEVLKLIA